MLLFMSLLGGLLSVILFYYNFRKSPSSIYLSVFFLLVSFYAFHHYIFIYTKSVFWICVLYVNTTSVFYLTGPMIYLYTRSVLTDDARLKRSDWWHFLPFVLHFAGAVPYILEPWSYKWHIAETIARDFNFMSTHQVNGWARIIGVKPIYLSRPLLALAYTVASAVYLYRFRRRNVIPFVQSQWTRICRWLIILDCFQVLLFLSFSSILVIRWPHSRLFQQFDAGVLEMLAALALVGLVITPFLFPGILYGLPHIEMPAVPAPSPAPVAETMAVPVRDASPVIVQVPVPVAEMEPETDEGLLPEADKLPEEGPAAEEERKQPAHQLEEAYLAMIGQKVEVCMEQQQPYLAPQFNLLKLASLIDIPAHHLSYLFREKKKQSFNDYRNAWKVSHAIRLLQAGAAAELTLEAIGQQSGFASRSAFFKAFKKVTGQAPGVFLGSRTGPEGGEG